MNRLLVGAAPVLALFSCCLPSAVPAQEVPRSFSADDAPTAVPSVGPSPRGVVTLCDAVAAALLGSPGLAAADWEVRVREAHARQAAALPNPQLGVEVENIGGSGQRRGVEQTETTVSLSQLVEIGGKRDKRRRAAALATELGRWDRAAARVELRMATARAFAQAMAAQRGVALAAQRVAVAQRALDDAARRMRAGAAPHLDVTRAELDLSSARLGEQNAQATRSAAYAALAATWGEAEPHFASLSDEDWSPIEVPPALASLEPRLDGHPAVARWRAEMAARRADLGLWRAQRLPDPTVALGARYFSDNDDAALVFAIGLPLPIFDRKQGDLLAAEREVARAAALAAAARREARAALAARHAEMAAAYQTITALREHLLPAAERAYGEARDGYAAGSFRSLEVLDAQRTLFELRAAELDAVLAYRLARVSIDGLTAAEEGELP